MEATLPAGTDIGSESRMSQDEVADTTPTPKAEAPAPGNLWGEFLRRKLLVLAGLASAASLRTAQGEAERAAED
jgi:hypothetical protein